MMFLKNFGFGGVGLELGASHMLGKNAVTKLHSPAQI